MRVLLVSTYELGHQPLHVASPAAALRAAGHEVRCVDLAVDRWSVEMVEWAEGVAFSAPMHTAMRLARGAVAELRRVRPDVRVAYYGLYAPLANDPDAVVIGGEYEHALVAWAGGAGSPHEVPLARGTALKPWRDDLPPLDRYAHLALGGEERAVGYVEASHGCAHLCRHCPIPVTYDGRIRTVARDAVLADIDQLVAMGARHITFGDPDFLNGWRHSLRIVEEMHEAHPELTFDVTTKVEHILMHESIWAGVARAGCLFVVSAFECVNDAILRYLDKGHTAAEAAAATRLLRRHGIEVRPSFMPFTPWTTIDDVADILEFVAEHDLVGNVDPVQYTIRLLLPEGSLLLGIPEMQPHLGPYDAELLTYTWTSPLDDLQARLTALAASGDPITQTYAAIRETVGLPPLRELVLAGVEGRPRLTEPWFC